MLRPPNTVNTSPYVPPVDPIAPLRAALRGHYDIEREIGQGAFATVYLARDLKHERKVALKVLNADPTSDVGELRFIREIRTLARLQHPNILPLHDSGHVEALLYYVMPYVSGDTVRDRIDREKQMSVEAACSIARDVADALAYAHAQGIIHRDIKPENILLSTGHPILADFGIARAIDLAGVRQLTRTGAASPGTPAYMSPEQLMADKELDGRSDTYSLGCVLFEMLTGKPPFAGKEGFVKRFTEPPPRASTLRKDLPGWLDDAIERALQREPRDRFPTAKEFVAALCPPESSDHGMHAVAGSVDNAAHRSPHLQSVDGGEARAIDWAQSARAFRLPSWRVLAPGLVAGVLVVAAVARRETIADVLRPAEFDSSRIAVLPFRGDRAQAAIATRNFEDALGRWQDLHVASSVEVSDALANGSLPVSLKEVRALARSLRTRRLLWGEVSRTGATFSARAELYDLAGPSDGPSRTVIVDGAPGERDAVARASMAILKKSDTPKWADGGDGATRSFAAWTAYGEGHKAFADLDLALAKASFTDAVAKDPQFAAARGWLAQVQQWTDPDSTDWRVHARSALAGVGTLNPRDRLVVLAVGALSAGAYPEACGRYAELAQLDSSNFVGWYGLGECRRLDNGVISDSKSPSGWRFRSSLHTATRMYLRALQLEPRVHALLTFERIERLLPTGTNVLRPGFGVGPDSARFAGYPTLAADTLAFVPYPIEKLAVLPAEATHTQNAALQRNSDLLLSFASEWTRQFPNSPDAHEALSDVLEVRGEISDGPSRSQSALAAILRAQRLTSDPHQQLRLSAREVRLRLKRSEFVRAGALADSVLGRYNAASEDDATELIGLAALTGKIGQTSRLARFGIWPLAVGHVAIAPSLGEAAANLFAHAALGACEPGARSLEDVFERQLQSYVPENQRDEIRGVLATRSFSMLAPCTGGRSALKIDGSHDRLFRMQQAFARKEIRTVRAVFDSLSKLRRDSRPGDLTLDYTYQEAWLKAAIGDTTAAIRQLDLALNALPSLNGISFRDPGVAAAVGRSFALRADLAFAQHDFQTAKHWAQALIALWRGADAPLQPTVMRMRRLASLNPA